MMKAFLILFVICEICIPDDCFSQSDSLTVSKTKWETKKIARGIRLRSFWYKNELFSSNQEINILEIKPRSRYSFDVEAEPKKLKPTSEFAINSNALAALNGTFFDMKNGGSMDYIRVDGNVVSPNRLQRGGVRALHQEAAILLNNEKVDIVSWDSTKNWEEKLIAEDVMVTGPLLVNNGKIVALDTTKLYMTRHPRSALAIKGKRILLITIDGRSDRAAGMTLHELAHFMKWMNVDKAINLDGGGSTTLWVKENKTHRIVNHPSDNQTDSRLQTHDSRLQPPDSRLESPDSGLQTPDSRLTHQRPVANVIVVKRKK